MADEIIETSSLNNYLIAGTDIKQKECHKADENHNQVFFKWCNCLFEERT